MRPHVRFHKPALVATAPSQSLQPRTELYQRLAVLTVGMALFNDVVLLLMLVPMLPNLFSPATDLQLTTLFAVKDVGQLICAPLAGALIIQTGARGSLAVSLLGLGMSTIAFAEARTFKHLMLARLCQGIASAAIMSGGLTLVAESHSAEERPAAMARAHSGMGLGATIGPVLGGFLFERFGRKMTFYAAASLVFLNAVLWLALNQVAPSVRSSSRTQSRRSAEAPLSQLVSLIANRDVAIVAFGIFAILAAGGLFDVVYGIHMQDTFHMGPGRASFIFSIEPLTYMLCMAACAPVANRISKKELAALGIGLVALSLPMLVAGNRMTSVYTAMIVHGLGYGMKDLVGNALLADLVDLHGVGSYEMAYALADMSDSIGYILGPLLGITLCRVLRSRVSGLLISALLCALLVPFTLGISVS
jgi:MFS family permease